MRLFCLNILSSTFLKTTGFVTSSMHCTEPFFFPPRKEFWDLFFLGIMTNASQDKQN